MQKKSNDNKIDIFSGWSKKCDTNEETNAGEVNHRKCVYGQ
jgi:hypothetical protein